MDEARTIGEILDEIKGREELEAAAKGSRSRRPGRGRRSRGGGESEEGQDLKGREKGVFKGKALAGIKNTLTTATGVVMPKHTSRTFPRSTMYLPSLTG